MSDVTIDKIVIIKRPHAIASKKSSFIAGVSNRVLVPLGFLTMLGSMYIGFWLVPLFIAYFILEIVLKYAIQLTMKELLRTLWKATFGKSKLTNRN